MGVNLGNSGSWNRYAYVVGDPVNRNDPTGRDDCPDEEGGPEDPGGCYGDGGGSGGNYCDPGALVIALRTRTTRRVFPAVPTMSASEEEVVVGREAQAAVGLPTIR